MPDDNISNAASDIADDVSDVGHKAAGRARKFGDDVGDATDRGARRGAAQIRRAGRQGDDAYDRASGEVMSQVEGIEDTIRRNPLASAGAALLVGLVLGRFFL